MNERLHRLALEGDKEAARKLAAEALRSNNLELLLEMITLLYKPERLIIYKANGLELTNSQIKYAGLVLQGKTVSAPGVPDSFENTMRWLKNYLSTMSPEKRVEALRDLQEGYCQYCGRDVPYYNSCHCENDE